jgi:hypothetical protein
MNPYCL